MARNSIQHDNISIALPDGWEDVTQVVAAAQMQKGFRANMVVSREPAAASDTAASFAARLLPKLRDSLTGYSPVNESDARFGSNTGFLREYTFVAEGIAVSQLQFYMIIGGDAYVLTFSDVKQRLSAERARAEQMFAQARITPRVAVLPDDDF
jgi:hypothetical protein